MQEYKTVYTFNKSLGQIPKFGCFNKTQRQFVVCSTDDARFVDMDKTKEIDLDDQENIKGIESIAVDDTHFYILANKLNDHLGYYLLEINQQSPEDRPMDLDKYFINWSNKFDIANASLSIMHEP
jgi:hypothetical protein